MKVSRDAFEKCRRLINDVYDIQKRWDDIWGVGRLRLLVDIKLRERFDLRIQQYHDALNKWDYYGAYEAAKSLEKGYKALDKAAREGGHNPCHPEVWEARLPDGSVAAIVKTIADEHHISRAGRYVQVWTLDQIGRYLGQRPSLMDCIQSYAGETVSDISTPSNYDWYPDGDEIPF